MNALNIINLAIILILPTCQAQNKFDHFKPMENLTKKPSALQLLSDLNATLNNIHIIRNKRDPFARKISPCQMSSANCDSLQKYSLSALRFIGTITQNQKNFALIQTPENIVLITKGQFVGINSAKVINITINRIKLLNINKQHMARVTSMYLKT